MKAYRSGCLVVATDSPLHCKAIYVKALIVAAALLTSLSSSAAEWPCTVHAKSGMADADLAARAKVTRVAAERTALKAVNIKSASIAGGELEAEGGCLIYSFDIQVPAKKSIVEVVVDAGSGKVLAKKREGPKAQAAEKAADAAATK